MIEHKVFSFFYSFKILSSRYLSAFMHNVLFTDIFSCLFCFIIVSKFLKFWYFQLCMLREKALVPKNISGP